MLNLFITGTDTDVGKTLVSCALLAALQRQGLSTIGYKPISAGCKATSQGLENADALALLQHSSLSVTLQQVNPIAFEPPIAPHIAAELAGTTIDSQTVVEGWEALANLRPDVLLTEGAGGWQLPINTQQTLPEVLSVIRPKVILVVGMRLGCLNHSLLTVQAIKAQGFELTGWIANYIEQDMPVAEQNIETLMRMIPAPLLGEIPFLGRESEHAQQLDRAVNALDLSQLLNAS